MAVPKTTPRPARKVHQAAMVRAVRKDTLLSQFAAQPHNTPAPNFNYSPTDWSLISQYTDAVSVRRHVEVRSQIIVTKIFQFHHDISTRVSWLPTEIRILKLMQPCNRTVQLLKVFDGLPQGFPDLRFCTAVFAFFPSGDLDHWRTEAFVQKRGKPVPESFVWRFLIQMSQALAFVHGQLAPSTSSSSAQNNDNDNANNANIPRNKAPIIHRDIKPKNILVRPNGSTYPSFVLHDFGCATTFSSGKAKLAARYGTYEWQPPENPFINTFAADIWSLGACVHFLCVGRAPIASVAAYRADVMNRTTPPSHPLAAQPYSPVERYYAARVPRCVTSVNLDASQQRAKNVVLPAVGVNSKLRYHFQYSDELDAWMQKLLSWWPEKRPSSRHLVKHMVPQAIEMVRLAAGSAGLVDLQVKIGLQ